MGVKMPPNFIKILAEENFLDQARANKWLIEYKKFLILTYMSSAKVVPSEQVDIVWHLHSAYMPHYRRMCCRIYGDMYPHNSAMKFGLSEESKEGYKETLAFYSDVFMAQPPADVWETLDAKAQMRSMNFRFCNIYRMAAMYSVKAKNPNMLRKKKKKRPAEEEGIPPADVPVKVPKEEIEAVEQDPDAAKAEIERLKAELEEKHQAKIAAAEEAGDAERAKAL